MIILSNRARFLYYFILAPFFIFSQDGDLQYWYNLELDYNFTKKTQLTLEGSGRQTHDFYFFIGENPEKIQKWNLRDIPMITVHHPDYEKHGPS